MVKGKINVILRLDNIHNSLTFPTSGKQAQMYNKSEGGGASNPPFMKLKINTVKIHVC